MKKIETAQRRAFLKYRANKCKTYTFTLLKERDKDIIELIDSATNKTDLIRQALSMIKQADKSIENIDKGKPIDLKEF